MPERYEALERTYLQLEADFHMMANSISQLAWMAKSDGFIFWYNQRWFEYTGTTLEDMQGWGWRAVHHPDHVERVAERITQAFQTGEPWEDTFPLRSREGEYRWFLSRAMPIKDAQGNVMRWFGTNTDITEQKRTEERQQLLMREIDHRAKNVLAVAQSVVNLTRADSIEAYKQAVEGRIASLARAHSLLAAARWEGADLRALLGDETRHFAGTDASRIHLEGPAVSLPPAVAQTLALIVHELATNAAKYGALSHANGRLDVTWTLDKGGLALSWKESGGTGVRAPAAGGFGTDLIDRILRDSGSILARDWRDEGLALTIHFAAGDGKVEAIRSHRGQSHPQRTPPRQKVRVLVVEDEPLTAMDLEVRLEDAGFGVIGPASSIGDARALLADDMPDIALLDGNLSGERSYLLAEELIAAGVPVVFCSGYEELEGLPESLAACPLVTKPFRDEALLSALSKAATSRPAAALA